jgi:type 1 glutamine amidotransferase
MKLTLRVCLVAIVAGCGSLAQAEDAPSKMLFVTQSVGFVHGSVNRKDGKLAPAEVAMIELGKKTGLFTCDCTQDCAADFTIDNLKKYDIVAFYTTLDLPIPEDARRYFFGEWIYQKGHGVLGFHSAGDTLHNYAPYWDMMGGVFIMHPWGAGTKVTLTGHEPDHPLSKMFGPEFVIQDEIYMYEHWQPYKCRVLLSLDYAKSPTDSEINTKFGYQVPVCWIKTMGDGKLYYNNLGHNETSWANPVYLDSITQAVKWMRGDIECDARPNPEVSKAMEEKSKKDFAEKGFKAAK